MDVGRVDTSGDGRRLDTQGDVAHLSDIVLVVAIARGHRDALAEVYRRHSGRVHRLARVVAGQDEAEEVVQEVFLQLWQKPERFEPHRGSLRTFLVQQAHCRAIDRLRSNAARRAREAGDLHRRPNPGTDVEAAALARLAAADVWGLVSALNTGERDAITLAYLGGLTYREVAGSLGQPEGTIKSRIRSGLTHLRAQMSDGWQNTLSPA